ncbi:pyrimidine-specific ribonucleoside hydrolase [Pilibacter termitis]|uniref:Pyrimidine-specific ribonucleoside hydrolase n=1 Tax=Pilibacter termitis TaxID=263852 RepID=A0A1T4LXE2_9ENTE|nr:nucleoside hydrolase [Pilibacter termitis]SJZ59335.1 pyrimidine-specific ribonucleoside hydrolase [Pilibacter termitis]
MKKNIWIDCDPGHDDALAILVALANPEKLNVLGISTIGGNQRLEKVTQNARNILQFIHAKTPLVAGQETPLVKTLTIAPEAHGDSGMDGPFFEDGEYPVLSQNAILYMYETLMKTEGKTTLVGLGPLTNLALLLKTFPEVKDKIECISIMGGGLDRGNYNSLAEFNIFVDPEAAHIVFHSGINIIMSGLDVTEKAAITLGEIQSLKNKGRVSQLVYELLSFYNESGKQFGFVDSPLHDLCAIAYLLAPDMFCGENYYVDVITDNNASRGMTFADKRLVTQSKTNSFVLLDVKRKEFVELLLKSLEELDNAR